LAQVLSPIPCSVDPDVFLSNSLTMAKYTLTYFDIRGLAETPRLMFAAAGVEYTDVRYSLTFGTPGDFSTISRPEFDAAKAAGELNAAAGKVPILDVDGVKIGQSKSIERYLMTALNLAGSSPVQAAQMDAVGEMVRDIKDAYNKQKAGKDKGSAELEAAMAEWFGEKLPAQLALLEQMIPASAGPYAFGADISYADIVLFQFLAAPGGFFDNTEGAKAAFQKCATIRRAMETTAANEKLVAHIAGRPERPM